MSALHIKIGGQGVRMLRGGKEGGHQEIQLGGIQITLDDGRRQLQITIPLTATHALFAKRRGDSLELADSLVPLYEPGLTLDERGILSLLEYGAIVPPLSPWREIIRLMPGRRFTISYRTLQIRETAWAEAWGESSATSGGATEDERVDTVEAYIDAFLRRVCPDEKPVILFSGGVDSGLIAARVAALGWRDAVLANYAMGKHDPDSELAEAMAGHLGLPFRRVMHDEHACLTIMDGLGATCPQPFGDDSILPTRRLCQAVLDQLKDHAVVLEGTGADVCFGYFGLVQSWQSVYRVPDALRRFGAALYVSRRLWLSPPSRVERWLRLARRASMLPLVAATVGQNPLGGVVYAAPASVQAEVSERLEEWMTKTLPSQEPGIRIIGLDLALGCANTAAQKSQPLFTGGPTRIAYPFLDPTIVSLALQRASRWPGREQRKQVLKAALARHVPRDMVYQPTSTFVAPMERIYGTPRFLDGFDRLLAADALLAPFVIRSSLQRLRRVLPSGAPLPVQTVNAVWSLTSANLWLEQIAQLHRLRESCSSLPGGTEPRTCINTGRGDHISEALQPPIQ